MELSQQRLMTLKEHAKKKLEESSSQYETIKKTTSKDKVILDAQVKKSQLRVSSLRTQIQALKNENVQLSNMCDELLMWLETKQ